MGVFRIVSKNERFSRRFSWMRSEFAHRQAIDEYMKSGRKDIFLIGLEYFHASFILTLYFHEKIHHIFVGRLGFFTPDPCNFKKSSCFRSRITRHHPRKNWSPVGGSSVATGTYRNAHEWDVWRTWECVSRILWWCICLFSKHMDMSSGRSCCWQMNHFSFKP